MSKFLAGGGQLPPIHPVGKDLGIKDESFNLGVYWNIQFLGDEFARNKQGLDSFQI